MTPHQSPDEAFDDRVEKAKNALSKAATIVATIGNDFATMRDERNRWKQRHADLILSTMCIVGALLLVIAGLTWTCLHLLKEGCK